MSYPHPTLEKFQEFVIRLIKLGYAFDHPFAISEIFQSTFEKLQVEILSSNEPEIDLLNFLSQIVNALNDTNGWQTQDNYFLGPDGESIMFGPVGLSPHVAINWTIEITGEIYIVVRNDDRLFIDLVIFDHQIKEMDYFGSGDFQEAHTVAFRAIKTVTDETTALKALWEICSRETQR